MGGPYAGAEFHHSRPLPARISFFYPVANSIDLSRDYWQRDASRPLRMQVVFNGDTLDLHDRSLPYQYTPFTVTFSDVTPDYRLTVSWRFSGDLPVLQVRLMLENRRAEPVSADLSSALDFVLRTCQTYTWIDDPRVIHSADGTAVAAFFERVDTDSACVFVINDGLPSAGAPAGNDPATGAIPAARFRYAQTLPPGGKLVVTQYIGSCRAGEWPDVIGRVRRDGAASVERYERSVLDAALGRGRMTGIPPVFSHSARWSRAMLTATRHYLDGRIVPMPCPAEYNFFFTHDLLLTDLGAVYDDTERVRDDLRYLASLTRPDSILPHAYYWRDTGYQTEFCGTGNWNHLWFVLLGASYLRHSGDVATIREIRPILAKSVAMMLAGRGPDGLMYADHPDWWDIGHTRGGRAYITALMVRALRDYAGICLRLDVDTASAGRHLALADTMSDALRERLWDAERGFLMNMFDSTRVDTHYYAGSLVAAAYGILDTGDAATLLATAERELLDPHLGIRNVMPPDFHERIAEYRFNGMEMGAPYIYINGGVWPQGIVWYALGLMEAGRPDAAREILERHFTLDGIAAGPNGQPAYFEYRNADPASPAYGAIDKPTFLWAGGWYLNALYRLAGVRENPWNIYLEPHLPAGWAKVDLDLMVEGERIRVRSSGEGRFFRRIRVDDRRVVSALLGGGIREVAVERGLPETPYLAAAEGMVTAVTWDEPRKAMAIGLRGSPGQRILLRVVSPTAFRNLDGGASGDATLARHEEGGVWIGNCEVRLTAPETVVTVAFR